jgi:hypothetical protein
MSDYPLTDGWVHIIQSNAAELGVTIVVSGVVIEGTLTPAQRWAEWTGDVLSVALQLGGGPIDGSTEPMSPAQADRIREEWKQGGKAKAHAEDGETPSFNTLYLRDTVIRSGIPADWRRVPFLAVSASHVSAFSIGTVTEGRR